MVTTYYKNKIGIIKITYDRKVESISLVDKIGKEDKKTNLTDKINYQIKEYLSGKLKVFDFYNDISLKGTEFQLKVWKELQNIPYGETRTYKEIAQAIGKPKAIRAVASAIGKNPIMIIIPCHRVIGSDGKLHGYAYGLDLKKNLLNIENSIFL